jgi:hypothetical protein
LPISFFENNWAKTSHWKAFLFLGFFLNSEEKTYSTFKITGSKNSSKVSPAFPYQEWV